MKEQKLRYALTHPQQRVWVTEKLYPGTGMWNNAGTLKIKGKLDYSLLSRAINLFIEENESIRLRIGQENGQPYQYISPYVPAAVDMHDFSDGGVERLYRWDGIQTEAPMPLIDCDLYYFALVKLGDNEGGLYAKFHHIITDALSIVEFSNQVMGNYEALLTGAEREPVQTRSYIDYIASEKEYLTSPRFAYDQKYWSALFEELPEPTVVKQKKTNDFSVAAKRKVNVIGGGTSRKIRKFCDDTGISTFAMFMSALAIYIHRITGKDDIIIGAPVAGRTSKEAKGAFGMFVSTVPFRIRIQEDLTFAEFAQIVSEEWFSALKHQKYPYDMLMQDLRKKHKGLDTLYDVTLSFQIGTFEKDVEQFTYEGRWHFAGSQANSLAIHVNDREADGRFIVDFDYHSPFFSDKEMAYFHKHMQRIMRDIISNPDKKLYTLELLESEERERVLQRFNDTQTRYETEGTLADLWYECAGKMPHNAPALVSGGTALTYGELDARSSALAAYLIKQGIGPEDIVGLLSKRTVDFGVCMLAIIKTGAAFLPIDAELPDERIAYMLADSGVKMLFVSPDLLEKCPEDRSIRCIKTNIPLALPADSYIPTRCSARSLAYVIYTSGSTGQPKGVMIEHHSIVHFVHSMRDVWDFKPDARLLCAASISFDISVMELVLALTCGATLVIAQEHEVNIPRNMVRLIKTQKVNMMVVTPGRMELLLSDSQGPACIKDFREIGMGGDVLSEKLLAQVQQSTGARITNFYGPTEITICCTHTDVTSIKIPNIGRPMPNVRTYILDTHMNPVPIGVPGELYVGGKGLARGYINKPELTAERFMDSPFEKGEKLYRTGDLTRWFPLGEIEFLGRIDKQVKIRGYRIELGEIESRLARLEGVTACAVADHEDAAGRRFLCAYLCGDIPKVADIKVQLTRDLPGYMIPSYFMKVNSLPMNQSGKVDRSKLISPLDDTAVQRDDYAPPETKTEQTLAGIWQHVLGIEKIGRDDSFFDIGGDSLSIVMVMAQIPQQFHVEIPLEDVYRHPQLKAFATLIDFAERCAYRPIVTAPAADDYPVSSAQQRMWVLQQGEDAHHAAYNIPIAFSLRGEIDMNRLQWAFEALIARHDALRTSFTLRGTELRQVIHDKAPFTLGRSRRSSRGLAATIKSLVRPFDMGQAPLMRAAYIAGDLGVAGENEENDPVLLIDLHHSIADARSVEIFMRDLKALYEGEALPAKAFEYKDYAVWQQDFMQSESIALQREFWQGALSGELPLLNLHTDRPRGAVHQFEGARYHFEIPTGSAEKLRAFAKQRGATPFMAVLAVYNVLLAKYTGQEDVIVGAPVSGRARSEVQDMLGVFINTLPLRNYPKAGTSFEQFFRELTERCVSAFAHSDYPLEHIVADLHITRDASRNPLYDTMLVQSGAPHGLALGDAELRHHPFDPDITKLDLTLEVYEGEAHMRCQFEYNTKLFNESTIARMSAHFARLVDLLIAEPDTRIRDVAMMTQEEIWQVTVGLNQTGRALPDISVQSLLEEHAAAKGSKMAVIAQDGRMSFGELNARANQAANHLRKMGVGRNSVVALCLPRKLDLIVGLFAVLKAGGGYLPIDPDYPRERISFMLEDSGAAVLIADKTDAFDFGGKTLRISDVPADEDADNLERIDRSEDTAYLIYTSGSTGKPKGAALPRRGLLNLFVDTRRTIAYHPGELAVSVTTVAFDIFIGDAVLPLLHGCTVALCSEEELRQPHLLAKLIHRVKARFIQTTPTRMRIMMDDASFREAAAKHIRKVVLGGEMIPPSLLEQIKRVTRARVINGYGPTEATVYSSFADLTNTQRVTIGRPVTNTRLYILDKFRRPVPVGVRGELYISGTGVAAGYIGRDELTREKFVPDPYWPGHMMYQTGDVCAFLEDGNVDIGGRVDHQVKIRGLRIELGEIEAAMRAIDGIEEAVVKDWGEGENKYLCAYYISSAPVPDEEIRSVLGEALPVYMVPNTFEAMDALPTTLNGKVDRKALVQPARKDAAKGRGAGVRMSPAERQMACVWTEVLGTGDIGPDDNFFHLGGDSLAVIKVQAAVLQYGWAIRTKDFYEAQTLSGVTASVNAEHEHEAGGAVERWRDVPIPEYTHLRRLRMENVLLTGATGYLGAHLLNALASSRGTRIHCLVRGENGSHAAARLRETLEQYFGAARCGKILARTSVHCGDIAEAQFGLSDKTLAIIKRADTIVHSAAITDHMGDADVFMKVNVEGTARVAAFAESAGASLLHVSTTSVSGTHIMEDAERACEFGENAYYIGQNYADNVYVKSKFLAEETVLEAVRRGLNARIMRVGNLSATMDGRFQKNPQRNAFASRIEALIAIGCVPVGMLDAGIEMTPVDACVAAMLTLADIARPREAVHHVFNTNTMSLAVLISLLEQCGNRIEIISDHAFMEQMAALSQQGDYAHLQNLVQDLDAYAETPKITISAASTVQLLSRFGFTWPVIDAAYMAGYLKGTLEKRKQGDKQA